jgi:hypothetical protein
MKKRVSMIKRQNISLEADTAKAFLKKYYSINKYQPSHSFIY